MDKNTPSIVEFFRGRDVFITGGSGKYALFVFTFSTFMIFAQFPLGQR